MINTGNSRRDFIRNGLVTAAALPLLLNCNGHALAVDDTASVLARLRKNVQGRGTEGTGAIEVPDSVSWRTAFPIARDDGEPMIISGTVFKADGKTPAPNTLIYFYHTDKFGIYGREGQPKH